MSRTIPDSPIGQSSVRRHGAGVRAGLTTTAPATVLMSCDGRMDAMPFDGTTAQTTRRPKPHITARD